MSKEIEIEIKKEIISGETFAKRMFISTILMGVIYIFCMLDLGEDLMKEIGKNLQHDLIVILSFLTILISGIWLTITSCIRRLRAIGKHPLNTIWMFIGFLQPYFTYKWAIIGQDEGSTVRKRTERLLFFIILFSILPVSFVLHTKTQKIELLQSQIKPADYFEEQLKEAEIRSFMEGKTAGYRSAIKEFRDAFPELLSESHWNEMQKVEASEDDREL